MIKSLLIKGAILCGASVLLVLGVLLLFPPVDSQKMVLQEPVNLDDHITINLHNSKVYIEVWDKDEIQVCESMTHQKVQQNEVKLTFKENTLDEISGTSINKSQCNYFFHSHVWFHLHYFTDASRYESAHYDYYITLPRGSHVILDSNGYCHMNEITVDDVNQPYTVDP